MALLADGVPLNQLYPLAVDRSLRSLERLGRANVIWHNNNTEPIQQLTSGAVPLANCFNGRVIVANRSGARLGFTPAYSAVSGNPYCVIASPANKKEAFEHLNYLLNTPKADAEYMQLTNYAIPNAEALKLIPSEIIDILPTSAKLRDRVFLKDDAWWAANLAKATAKFKEWQLAG
jgi:putative spermidine/putrescine transport system substrate-binding protein